MDDLNISKNHVEDHRYHLEYETGKNMGGIGVDPCGFLSENGGCLRDEIKKFSGTIHGNSHRFCASNLAQPIYRQSHLMYIKYAWEKCVWMCNVYALKMTNNNKSTCFM